MNIYDTKVIVCGSCKKAVGEVEFDSLIIRPLCGQCANPLPYSDLMRDISNLDQNKLLVKVPHSS